MKLCRLLVLLTFFLLGTTLVFCEDEAAETGEAKEENEAAPEIKVTEAESESDDDEDDSSEETEDESDVLVLTNDNFDDAIQSNNIILVEFYAPWCGHCKMLEPEYEKAATELKTNDPPVVLGKVDATVHGDLASKYDVSGYPTLKFFKDGSMVDYEGPRTADGIVEYMKERADPNWKPPPDAVLTLTTDNFNEIVQAEALMLVEFYAPWCGHCKKLAPEYEKAAKQLAMSDPPIKLGKVDATVESTLGSKYEVTGYPTLKLFRFGKAFEYKGGRDTHGIVEYMEKQRGDGTKLMATLKDLQKFVKDDDVTVVGIFKDDQSELFSRYTELSNDMREEFTFVHTFDPAVASHCKASGESIAVVNALRFESKYEPKTYTLKNPDATVEEMKTFIMSKQNPLVGQYSVMSSQRRYKDVRPLMIMFYTVDFSFDHRKATNMWRLKLADIANSNKDMTFAIADEDDMSDLFKQFGFDESGEEINIGILGEKDTRYPMPAMDEFDADEIAEFLTKFKNGKLKPKLNSQPVPKKQKGPVTVVVGKTFEKIVLDPKKDVMIELYAPWCGHCKNLEPVYKDVAKHFKSNKNIVIAKMDATANDAPPQFASSGFPTIYFAPAGHSGEPMKYEGARGKDDFIKYIEENASTLNKKKDEL